MPYHGHPADYSQHPVRLRARLSTMIFRMPFFHAVFTWTVLTIVAHAADLPAGREVPAAMLDRLQAQYVPADAKSADLSDGEKVHRYETILREGEFLEKAFAGAPRTCIACSRPCLVRRRGWQRGRRREGRGPGVGDCPADGCLRRPAGGPTVRQPPCGRVELDSSRGAPQDIAAAVDRFLRRYHATPARSEAYMSPSPWPVSRRMPPCEKNLSKNSEWTSAKSRRPWGSCCGRECDCPATPALFSRLRPWTVPGWSCRATCWPLRHAMLLDLQTARRRPGGGAAPVEKVRSSGLALDVLAVNLDRDRQPVEQFIRQNQLNWIHIFSGLGSGDPLLRRYGSTTRPCFWIILSQGKANFFYSRMKGGPEPGGNST